MQNKHLFSGTYLQRLQRIRNLFIQLCRLLTGVLFQLDDFGK